MTRNNIIFIRHSQSRPAPGQPPSQWPLTDTGRQRCVALATRMRAEPAMLPDLIVCSEELKPRQTGALIAERLGLPHTVAPGLHEHARERVDWLGDDEFARAVAALFARPDELVFGEETATEARERFAAGVRAAVAANPTQRLAIVTHGTVLALFLAQQNGLAAESFWRRLGMPALARATLPNFQIAELIERVE